MKTITADVDCRVSRVTFSIPTPPSTNNLFRAAGNRRVKTDGYSAWLRDAGWQIRSQRVLMVGGPVAINLDISRPARGRSDLDNRIKAALDLLVKMRVIEDDSCVQEIVARWRPGEGCRVEIRAVGEIGREAAA